MTHIRVSKLIIIGSDNGLSPGRRQAIILTNAGILLIGPIGTNFSEIHTFSFKENAFEKVLCEMASICLGLNVLIQNQFYVFINKYLYSENVSINDIRFPLFSSHQSAVDCLKGLEDGCTDDIDFLESRIEGLRLGLGQFCQSSDAFRSESFGFH